MIRSEGRGKTDGLHIVLIYQMNSICLVRSPYLLPCFTTRPTMSSSNPIANVAPLPPATNMMFSYCPQSKTSEEYGPSIRTETPSPVSRCDNVESALMADESAWSLSVLVHLPITRAASNIPDFLRSEGIADTASGAFRIVKACDSFKSGQRRNRILICCPPAHPLPQSGM